MPQIPHMTVNVQFEKGLGDYVAVFVEKAQGVSLVDPHVFTLPGDTVLEIAAAIIMARMQTKQQMTASLAGQRGT